MWGGGRVVFEGRRIVGKFWRKIAQKKKKAKNEEKQKTKNKI
jgi:hypothetical protein